MTTPSSPGPAPGRRRYGAGRLGSAVRPNGAVRLGDPARLVRYLTAGGCAAATHFVVLTLLVERGGLRPVVASALGFLCGLVVSYLLQRNWVFRASAPHRRSGPRFLFVVGLGLALNSLVMWIGTEWLDHHYALVQLVAFAAQPINNYLWHSLWTFRPAASP